MLRTIRFFSSNLKTFTELEALNQYLAKNKFDRTLVYFRANWNPNCSLTDQHITRIATENPDTEVIKVDSDVSPKISKHYGVKAEPEFVFCLHGDEVIRQTGPNYEGLNNKLNKMTQLADNSDLSGFNEKWVPYGTKFEEYYNRKLKTAYKAYTSTI